MDPSSSRQHEEHSNRAGTELKLPKINKSAKDSKVRSSETWSASTSSSDKSFLSSENLLPQIVISNTHSDNTGLDFKSTDKSFMSEYTLITDGPSVSRAASMSERRRILTPCESAVIDESKKATKLLRLRTRGTMTLLSPTPADIEDAIRRHGPYEGALPVIRTEFHRADLVPKIRSKMSLSGVMAVIDRVSYREVGFDPEQLVRTDPTVAKAVCEILQEHTNEDQETLTKIALALCDDRMSNGEVLTFIESNVKMRTGQNIGVYFAMAFFISKTKDPTRTQSSNSALMEDASLSGSKTFVRSDSSVTFLMSALSKFMLLAQTAASGMSKDPKSDSSPSPQQRQSFVKAAELFTRLSIAESGRRQSMDQSFDFQTPSGWFFEEVAVDEDMVETIRQSMPALMDLVEKAELLFDEREKKIEEQSAARDGKKSPKYKKGYGSGLPSPREDKEHGSGLTTPGEGKEQGSSQASPRKDKLQSSREASPGKDGVKLHKKSTEIAKQAKKAEAFSRRAFTHRRKPRKQRQQFLGWDSTTDLAAHWMKQLPKETDLIVPMLQNIRRFESKDASESSERDVRTRSTSEKSIKSLTSRSEGKDVSESSERDVRTQSTSEKSIKSLTGRFESKDVSESSERDVVTRSTSEKSIKKSITKTLSFESALTDMEPRVQRTLKVAFGDRVVEEPSEQAVDLSVILSAQSQSAQSLSVQSPLAQSLPAQSLSAQSLSTQSLSLLKSSRKATLAMTPACAAEARPIESAQTYLSKHRILELFVDLITHLVMTMPQNPLDSLIDTVHQLNEHKEIEKYCSKRPVPPKKSVESSTAMNLLK